MRTLPTPLRGSPRPQALPDSEIEASEALPSIPFFFFVMFITSQRPMPARRPPPPPPIGTNLGGGLDPPLQLAR
jgi:hypothetical protein